MKLIAAKFVGKAKVINRAVQDIGMGPYQWGLFVLCGMGWVADKYVLPSQMLTIFC